jgi:hypothetical protein
LLGQLHTGIYPLMARSCFSDIIKGNIVNAIFWWMLIFALILDNTPPPPHQPSEEEDD